MADTICLHFGCKLDLCRCNLESAVQVMCDMGYLFANFSLPRPVCSRLRPDVHDTHHVCKGGILTFHDTLHYTDYAVCVINSFSFTSKSFLVLWQFCLLNRKKMLPVRIPYFSNSVSFPLEPFGAQPEHAIMSPGNQQIEVITVLNEIY